jgi:hypothetical protein
LQAENEGTKACLAKEHPEIIALVKGGLTPAEAVLPYTRPEMRQGLFFE